MVHIAISVKLVVCQLFVRVATLDPGGSALSLKSPRNETKQQNDRHK